MDVRGGVSSLVKRFKQERFSTAVQDSEDLQRIKLLDRRPVPTLEEQQKMADIMTALLRRDNPHCRCAELEPHKADPCIKSLFPIQGWYLWEAMLLGGAIGLLEVGSGKTGIDCLLAMVLQSPDPSRPLRAVLLLPPSLREQFFHDFECWSQHFKTPNLAGGKGTFTPGRPTLDVLAYSELSRAGCATWLKDRDPDAVFADEVQNLKAKNATCTDRFLRFFAEGADPAFSCHTGSLTTSSTDDYCVSPESRVLTADLRWVRADSLKPGDELIGFDEEVNGKEKLRRSTVERAGIIQAQRVRVATDQGTVVTSTLHGFVRRENGYNGAARRKWVEARALKAGDEIAFYTKPWEALTSHSAGYLAGLLDGEGWCTHLLGMAQRRGPVLDAYVKGMTDLGFDVHASEGTHTYKGIRGNDLEKVVNARLRGGSTAAMRAVGMLRPHRLLNNSAGLWEGRRPYGKGQRVFAKILSVEPLEEGAVCAIQTSTKTLIVEGMLSHNSHLAALCLKLTSPLPLEPSEAATWGMALSSKPVMGTGALRQLCWDEAEEPLAAFGRRLIETPGVITTSESQTTSRLIVNYRPLALPEAIAEHLRVQRAGTRPDGHQLEEHVEVVASCRQLACGFYYRWRYPVGALKPECSECGGHKRKECERCRELIDDWFAKRKAWNAELREKLEYKRDNLDSEALLTAAAERWEAGDSGSHDEPAWESAAWPAWRDIRDTVEPVPDAVHLDDFLIKDAIEWAKGGPGIIWYSHDAVGERLEAVSGFPLFEGGDIASEMIRKEKGDRVIIASARAHGTGKNLQMFNRALVTSPFANGTAWEQVIGRMDRRGQLKDTVTVDCYAHTPELIDALRSAWADVMYVKKTTPNKPRLWRAEGTLTRDLK